MSKSGIIAAVAALIIAVVYVELRLGDRPAAAPSAPPDNSALEARLDRIEDMLVRISPGPIPDVPDDLTVVLPLTTVTITREPETPIEDASAAPSEKAAKVKEFIARIEKGEVAGEEMNQLWNLLSGSGLHDQALSALLKNSRAHPNDADAHYGLGIGAISKLVGGQVTFQEQGQLSMLADQAFDRALEIDDHHFGARYSKAISYTYWPEALGKGPAAIAEFETLRQQSAQDSSIPMLDQVYTNLGIQYRKAGNPEKSREALEEGLRVFPDSKEIQEQLEAMGD